MLQQAIDEIRFGTLVTYAGGELQATQLPMIVEPGSSPHGVLAGHIARNNPQWRAAESAAAIATFVGAHFYVSPAWYATKRETGRVVPTWNYIAVEARGTVRFFHDHDRLLTLVERLTRAQEERRADPWAVGDAPESYIEAMLHAIVGFEMPIDTLEGAWKLGQHKTDADRDSVADGVAAASDDPAVRALLPLLRPPAPEPLRPALPDR